MDVIIETPKGSCIKYLWDEEIQMYRANKLLGEGLVFPYDFGFIPQTLGDDGDPLDVMVISECETFPGIAIDVRIIGCIRVKQSKKEPLVQNDRFLAIPDFSREYASVKDIATLPEPIINKITGFLRNYVEAAGKKIEIEGLVDVNEALELIRLQPAK